MPITLDDVRKVDNGAKFYTADLHIHSYGGSSDVKDSAMTPGNILDHAIKQGISLIAITDHNSDANVAAALEYGQKYLGQIVVIPGAEITTANGHLLVYFPPEKTKALRDFLGRIAIEGEYGARDSHTKLSMANVIVEAERLDGIAVAAHIDRDKTGFESAISGFPSAKKDILISSGLSGLEFDDPAFLNWYSPEDERTPAGAERIKLYNARLQSSATAPRPRLAAVQNSDSHTLVQFTAKRTLTRYKMNELGFEGLRTALIDSESRVRAVATIPPSVPRVLGMHVSGGFLANETFSFSDNLNTFIGGRGAGKSTSIRCLAYGLGIADDLEEHDNCPETVVIYCEDDNGILYRYERSRGFETTVRAKDDAGIKDVPVDSFRIEYFGQGDLAEVAKNPLKNASLLQEFLDRHITIHDLCEHERELLEELAQNSGQLIPLLSSNVQLPGKRKLVSDLDVKLKVAETGKVKEIAAYQITLAAEKSVANALFTIAKSYNIGLSLATLHRDYAALESGAGKLTGDQQATQQLQIAKGVIENANAFLRSEQTSINAKLKDFGQELEAPLQKIKQRHSELDQLISERMADLRKKGLSGSLEELNRLIGQRTSLMSEVSRLENEIPLLNDVQTRRNNLLQSLSDVRDEIMKRRKGQLTGINRNLGTIIKDYSVNLHYEHSGLIDEFKRLMLRIMQGSWCPEEIVDSLCLKITPRELADLIRSKRPDEITKLTGVAANWSQEIVQRFQSLTNLHELEITWKPPMPKIKVLTKGASPKPIAVNQLSDGQKHTILLTIAMLSESNLPLVIDQPEDDLDNAFIFTSVVATLRTIKERRQVILVTHNANIAVLGDSELLFPMKRSGDQGTIFDRGSIDRPETKAAVQAILEGGEMAFRRRKEIYGY